MRESDISNFHYFHSEDTADDEKFLVYITKDPQDVSLE